MSTNIHAIEWINLTACPIIDYITIPMGIDGNNYIAIDRKRGGINHIYKYNIDNDKWITMYGFKGKGNIPFRYASLDVKNQILFLLDHDKLTQIQLNNTNTIQNCQTNQYNEICYPHRSEFIAINNSLLIIGGRYNKSILNWNLENKTISKFSDMYNKNKIGKFGMIYNSKQNCLLLF
eukprot:30183_1